MTKYSSASSDAGRETRPGIVVVSYWSKAALTMWKTI